MLKSNSQLAIIAANINLLIGIILFGSNLGALVFFYWIEMLIHGVFFVSRLYLAVLYHPMRPVKVSGANPLQPTDYFYLLLLSFHYFAFIYGQYEGIHLIIGQPPSWAVIIFTTIPMVISHYWEFKNHYLSTKTYLTTSPGTQMFKAYQRVIFSTLWIMGSVLYLRPERSYIAIAAGILAIKTLLDLVSNYITNISNN